MKFTPTTTRKHLFTLMESLLVITTITLLAGSISVSFHNSAGLAKTTSENSKLQMLKTAIQKFKTDTGYLPQTGPFAYGNVNLNEFEIDAELEEYWFKSPANFVQLFVEPIKDDGLPIMKWSAEVNRGWDGPYLNPDSITLIVIGDNKALVDESISADQWQPNYEPEEEIDGESSSTPDYHLLPKIYAVLGTYKTDPRSLELSEWPRQYFFINDSTEAEYSQSPPYLFIEDQEDSTFKIISFGPNGLYDDQQDSSSDNVSVSIY